jgi:apocytochrome f
MIKILELKKIKINFSFLFLFFAPQISIAFPIYAQQAYENPREANGRIVCANCHLAKKPAILEAPTAVLPNAIFNTALKIPYDETQKQLLENGKKGDLNVGAIVLLPEGFSLAPKNKLTTNAKDAIKNLYIAPYSPTKENILVVGPVEGKRNKEIVFPIQAPDPEKNKKTFFAKYPIYAGANRGRAQVNPNGEKTNNNPITSLYSGKISTIIETEQSLKICFLLESGEIKEQILPKYAKLLVKKEDTVTKDQLLTINPNVGGFGQAETEIVLQDPSRIYAYMAFCFLIIVAQLMLVLKKKQFEKVQIADLDV